MNIKSFMRKYDGVGIEDDGAYPSKQFLTFAKDFKALMQNVAKNVGATLASYNVGHYDVSGFLAKDGKYLYFSFSVPRGEMPLTLQTVEFSVYRTDMMKVLVRHAKHSKDYTGGHNEYLSINDLEDGIGRLFNETYR